MQAGEDGVQLPVIAAHPGIGRRHHGDAQSHVHGRQRQQRQVHAVVRQRDHRIFRANIEIQQRLADVADRGMRLAVADGMPARIPALRQEDARRLLGRPSYEPIADAAIEIFQRYRGAQDKAAIGQVGAQDAGLCQPKAGIGSGGAAARGIRGVSCVRGGGWHVDHLASFHVPSCTLTRMRPRAS